MASSAEWEERFRGWAQPPSESEQERIERAVTAIRNAINASDLADKTKVYVQGSYRNRVNVRQDSDVDIGVLYTGIEFYGQYPPGKMAADFGVIKGDYGYSSFKNDVGVALTNFLGSSSVTRGNKAFDVHANTYRIDADVVPVFEHRRYQADGSYICGVQFFPDTGAPIINWPERLYDNLSWPAQHYEEGVLKNDATGRAYKGAVRILKKLRHTMLDAGIESARPIAGFLLECLVYNVPNEFLVLPTWDMTMQKVFANIRRRTSDAGSASGLIEVSGLKYLFHGSPDEKRLQAYTFIDQAWDFVGVRSYG